MWSQLYKKIIRDPLIIKEIEDTAKKFYKQTKEDKIKALKLLEKYENIKVTRLAHGLPMGAQLDYADEMTLFKAFSNRKEVK